MTPLQTLQLSIKDGIDEIETEFRDGEINPYNTAQKDCLVDIFNEIEQLKAVEKEFIHQVHMDGQNLGSNLQTSSEELSNMYCEGIYTK